MDRTSIRQSQSKKNKRNIYHEPRQSLATVLNKEIRSQPRDLRGIVERIFLLQMPVMHWF
jgi:hypothetical protein